MDHVRGSSLAWPESLETLRPFIVTWWSGRTIEDMPSDIAGVFSASGIQHSHINLALVALDSKGDVLRSTVPFVNPPSFGFDAEAQGRNFKAQLDELLLYLNLPVAAKPAKPKLTLPDVPGKTQPSGVRIFLTFAENRLNHYRTPIVEAVALTDVLRKSLRCPTVGGTLNAAQLRPWLEQIYPAAIMDGQGGFQKIDGKLEFKAAGSDSTYHYAVAEGDVQFVLDNANGSSYHGTLSLVFKYRRSDKSLYSLRGVFEGDVPKGPEWIHMTAAIESLPK